ncbi:MAG: glycogen-binding domain-containing protein [Sandaracinaceae bacterium]|nr:glycogen-binding domain-containing protein [Sandaracinaceae bacterium]
MTLHDRVRAWAAGELSTSQEEALFEDAERDPELLRALEAASEASVASALARVPAPEPAPDLVQRSVRRAIERREAQERAPWWRRAARALVHGRTVRLRVSVPVVLAAAAAIALAVLYARRPASTQVEVVEAREIAVRLVLRADGARSVAVAGDFNDWATDRDVLEDPEGDGIFVGTVRVVPGSYAYMFVVDSERWIDDPYAANHRDDGFGNRNAVLRID